MAPLMEIEVFAAYRQVAVFDPTLTPPFNGWTGEHVRQGFSWRPGSVSFATIVDGGRVRIRVGLADALTVPDRAVRALVVPFVMTGQNVQVGGLFSSEIFPLPAGSYELLYALVPSNAGDPETCYLRFVPCANPVPRYLRVDAELDPLTPPFMDAEPA